MPKIESQTEVLSTLGPLVVALRLRHKLFLEQMKSSAPVVEEYRADVSLAPEGNANHRNMARVSRGFAAPELLVVDEIPHDQELIEMVEQDTRGMSWDPWIGPQAEIKRKVVVNRRKKL